MWESTFSSTVQNQKILRFELCTGDTVLHISQNRNCASGDFRKSVCLISYIIVCMYFCLFVVVASAASGGGGVSTASSCK